MTQKTIHGWAVVIDSNDPYKAPELWTQKISGLLDSEDSDHWIKTSSIKGKRGEFLVTNSGSEYILGSVNPEYELQFPNARKRLFDSLPEV